MSRKKKKFPFKEYAEKVKRMGDNIEKLAAACDRMYEKMPDLDSDDLDLAYSCEFVADCIIGMMGDMPKTFDVTAWAADVFHSLLINDEYEPVIFEAIADEVTNFYDEDCDYPKSDEKFALACTAALRQCGAAIKKANEERQEDIKVEEAEQEAAGK